MEQETVLKRRKVVTSNGKDLNFSSILAVFSGLSVSCDSTNKIVSSTSTQITCVLRVKIAACYTLLTHKLLLKFLLKLII